MITSLNVGIYAILIMIDTDTWVLRIFVFLQQREPMENLDLISPRHINNYELDHLS